MPPGRRLATKEMNAEAYAQAQARYCLHMIQQRGTAITASATLASRRQAAGLALGLIYIFYILGASLVLSAA